MVFNNEKFEFTQDTPGEPSLVFDSKKVKEWTEFALQKKVKKVLVMPYKSNEPKNLDALLPLKEILEVLIIAEDNLSYSQLHEFSNLKHLSFSDNGKDKIDLNYFPNLSWLTCSLNDRVFGLENCKKLKYLSLENYRNKSKDLTEIPQLENLEDFSLLQTNITSLIGIEKFKNLKILSFYGAPKLESLAQLELLSKTIEEIEIDHCKLIKDFEVLGKMKKVKKILLSDSGEIKSLSFIKLLTKLEFLSFVGTKILDGNLHYCEGIKYTGFDDKKHYTHKMVKNESTGYWEMVKK